MPAFKMLRKGHSFPVIAYWLMAFAFANLTLAQEDEVEPSAEELRRRADLTGLGEQLARLAFDYEGNLTPAEFIESRPCVAGDWEFESETDEHWIGMLYYISDNAQPEVLFGERVKIRKSRRIKFDPKKWKGRVLLLKNNPKWVLGKPSDETTDFTLVGYDKDPKFLDDGLLNLHEILPYKPVKPKLKTIKPGSANE